MKTENVLVVFHFQTFLYLFQINVLFLRLQKTLQKNLYFSDVSIKYRKGALAWKALLKGKCFGKDYFLVNQSAEIMYMYRTTNHWSNRTENWVSNIKDVYQKKENHPPREKGKGIKLRRIQSIEKELWSVTKTTKKNKKCFWIFRIIKQNLWIKKHTNSITFQWNLSQKNCVVWILQRLLSLQRWFHRPPRNLKNLFL